MSRLEVVLAFIQCSDENYQSTNSDNVRKKTSTSGSISGFIGSSGNF